VGETVVGAAVVGDPVVGTAAPHCPSALQWPLPQKTPDVQSHPSGREKPMHSSSRVSW
jgi:hypothetical protein